MSKYSNFLRRAQIWVLTLALLLPVISPMFALSVIAADDKSVTVSVGKIVANNYDLKDAEGKIIGSGLLVGGELTYQKPELSDDLVKVDSENNSVSVKDYKDPNDNEWKAISAKIIVDGETVETVAIVNGEGTYKYDGNAFSVDVEYALDTNINEDLQKLLLSAPKDLYEGLEVLSTVSDISGYLSVIEAAMPTMVLLATDGYKIDLDWAQPTLTWAKEDANASTLALNDQMTKNGGKLDITVLIDEYKDADSKIEFLVNNGAELKAVVEETQVHLANILESGLWTTVLTYAPDGDEKETFKLLNTAIINSKAALAKTSDMNWSATEKQIVKADATHVEYVALDALVALTNGSFSEEHEIENPLRVTETVIRYNMSMFNVTVQLVLQFVANNELVEYSVKPVTVLTLAEGASKSEVLSAVEASGIVKSATTVDWAGIYVDGKYEASETELDDTLTSDITYTITYTPKKYEVVTDYNGTSEEYYGYVLILPVHSDATKAYDYTVNGTYYAQGSQVKVVENLNITRKEGKAYTTSNFYKIVADNYLSGKGASILNSGALKNNVSINVRYPDNRNNIVTLVGNTLTAENYDSSYAGLAWVPYSYTLSNGTTGLFGKSNEVELPVGGYDHVTVTYRLVLANFDDETVLDAANLADLLNKEAADQLSVLNSLAAQKGNLEMLNGTMINILKGYVKQVKLNPDPAKDEALKAIYTEALDGIIANCLNSKDELKLYEIVGEYDQASDKLYYYYLNSESIISEVTKLAGYLNDLLSEDDYLTAEDKIEALRVILDYVPDSMIPPSDVDRYVEKFIKIENDMNSYMDRLKAPNEVIDLESDKLGVLTAALRATGSTVAFDTVDDLCLEDSTIVVVPEGNVVIIVKLTIQGGTTVTITSDNIEYGETVEADVINKLIAAIDAELAKQGVEAKYYDTDYVASALEALIGKASSNIETTFEFNWTYKTFVVKVPGMADQTVSYVDRLINLAKSTNPEYRYDYYINGTKVGSGVYSLTDKDLDNVIEGKFVVTREIVEILREDLINYVNKLNSSVGSNAFKVTLVEDEDGNFSIVLKINTGSADALSDGAMALAQAILTGTYSYVGVDEEALLLDHSVYLQSIVDMMLNSGFADETILNAINADGSINHMTLEGTVISGDNGVLGGKLVETTMQLGNNPDEVVDVDFYVTVTNTNSVLMKARNILANRLKAYFSFVCEDGSLNIKLNMPEKMYEAILAVLLVTEDINLNNINDVNAEIVATFANNLLIPLLNGDITVKTFENTAVKLGMDIDVSSIKGIQTLYDILVDFYTNADFTYDEKSGTATGVVGISEIIDKFDLGELADIIVEKDTGLNVSVKVEIENLGKDYEAIFLDVSAEGITNKVGLTDNLSTKLGTMKGKAFIVLLSDIDSDLVANTSTIINLNGYTVNGDVVANAKTVIIDSHLGEERTGTVNGTVSGNAIIVDGTYSEDVSAFVKAGYIQDENGKVLNEFFDIVETDDNIDVIFNADLINTTKMPSIVALALEIAGDLVFNGYTSSSLAIDGNTIYSVSFEDLLGFYTSTNRKDQLVTELVSWIDSDGITALVNTVIDDVLDFASVSEAIAAGDPVVEYSFTTERWAVEVEHVTDGDYITANIVNGETSRDKNLRVLVTGSDENVTLLSDLFAELGKTVTADVNVTITHGKDGKELSVKAADMDVYADWSDPSYAVMFSTIIADSMGAPKNADLIAGIEEYYATKHTEQLENAFNALTTTNVVNALKDFHRNDSFVDMVAALGLDSVIGNEVYDLENLYDSIGKVAAYIVRKADIKAGGGLIGTRADDNGVYSMSRANIQKIIERTLVGYLISADVEVTNAKVAVKLFEHKEYVIPEFVDGHGAPVLDEHDDLAAYRVDTDNKYIIIDVHPDGIDADVFKSLLNLTALNDDNIDIVYKDGTITSDNLVKTGTVIVATASNKTTTETDVVEYTVIVLGDVNCDGSSDVADAILICRDLVGDLAGDEALNELQVLASDINDSGRTDIGDATKIANKVVSEWEDYESFLVG